MKIELRSPVAEEKYTNGAGEQVPEYVLKLGELPKS